MGGESMSETNSTYDLGSQLHKWNNIYTGNLNATTITSSDNLMTVIYNSITTFLTLTASINISGLSGQGEYIILTNVYGMNPIIGDVCQQQIRLYFNGISGTAYNWQFRYWWASGTSAQSGQYVNQTDLELFHYACSAGNSTTAIATAIMHIYPQRARRGCFHIQKFNYTNPNTADREMYDLKGSVVGLGTLTSLLFNCYLYPTGSSIQITILQRK
jgi:hypothetical protein